jgi:F-type H+-transporting ATPase subunit b
MLEINFTLLVQTANFIILMFLLNFLLFRPMLSFLSQRKGMIDQTLAEARDEESKAEEVLESYHETLTDARRAADARFGEAQAGADEDRRRLFAEAELRAQESIEEASGKIRQASEEARGGLRAQSRALAEAIAEKVLGRRV